MRGAVSMALAYNQVQIKDIKNVVLIYIRKRKEKKTAFLCHNLLISIIHAVYKVRSHSIARKCDDDHQYNHSCSFQHDGN